METGSWISSVTKSHTTWEDSSKGIFVRRETVKNVGHISINRAKNAYMFSRGGERYLVTIKREGVGDHLDINQSRLRLGRKSKKFCFLWDKFHMVLLAVLNSQVQKQ